MSDRGSEKGIKPDEDYGTPFLDARKSEQAGTPPPTPPPAPAAETSGNGKGRLVVAIVVAIAVIGGAAAAFALTSGGDSSKNDLLTAGPGVDVDPDNPRVEVTTTTQRRATTTEAPTTTTTTAPPAATTVVGSPTTLEPGNPVVTPPPNHGTVAPSCPSGSVNTDVGKQITGPSGGPYQIQLDGLTKNNTAAAIVIAVDITIGYYVDGSPRSLTVSAPVGLVASPFQSKAWRVTKGDVTADSLPLVQEIKQHYRFADTAYASCSI